MTTRESIARAIEARADELDRDPGPYLRVDQVQLSAGLRWAARIARETEVVQDDSIAESLEDRVARLERLMDAMLMPIIPLKPVDGIGSCRMEF